jgi:murein DD-endopeptidase MepM/ murein hydrolase activator NlpD
MMGHRTTPRGISFLFSTTALAVGLVVALSVSAAGAAPNRLPVPVPPPGSVSSDVPAGARTPSAHRGLSGRSLRAHRSNSGILFPVLGKVRYIDDFGDPRGQGSHEGNDILVARRSPVVAVEDGKIKWWTTSARAGCMLYLYGKSGTTYLYIHLNNDRTLQNDNSGGCTGGGTFTAADGSRVSAGQQIAWSGDSGDADGNPHLHFEVHPGDGAAVDPFETLNGAVRPLFPARAGAKAAVGLRGTILSVTTTGVDVGVDEVRWWPGGVWLPVETRVVQVAIDAATAVDPVIEAAFRPLGGPSAVEGTKVTIVGRAARATVESVTGHPGSIVAARIRSVT